MSIKTTLNALQASALTLAIALPSVIAAPVAAQPGAFKPGFTAAAKGAPKAALPKKAPAFKPKKPANPRRTIAPSGKPKVNPGLPKPRQKPVTANTLKKPGGLKKGFNKQAGRKPLKDIFNPAARPPAKPIKGDPPPTPRPTPPKGPGFTY